MTDFSSLPKWEQREAIAADFVRARQAQTAATRPPTYGELAGRVEFVENALIGIDKQLARDEDVILALDARMDERPVLVTYSSPAPALRKDPELQKRLDAILAAILEAGLAVMSASPKSYATTESRKVFWTGVFDPSKRTKFFADLRGQHKFAALIPALPPEHRLYIEKAGALF